MSKQRKQYSVEEQHERLVAFITTGINTMHVCRHSGGPDAGLLIGRSVFPIAVNLIHYVMVGGKSGLAVTQRLEDLKSEGIIDELTHINLRRAAAALGDYGTGRDLADVMAACDILRRIIKSEAYKIAAAEREAEKAAKREAKAKAANRPRWMRWATAAAGLFAVGQ